MYVNTQTLQRVTEQQIRAEFPNVSFPKPFKAPEGYAVLFPTPQPTVDPITQFARETTPVEIDGKWCQAWEIVEQDAEAIAANTQAAALKVKDEIVFNTQKRLDEFARTRNYDGILSACTYATSVVPKFAAEGQYCVNARDNTWATLYTVLAEVEAGARPVPSGFADVEPLLPALVWPV